MSLAKIVKLDANNPRREIIAEAGSVIKKGGLVIIPTETVYGIAANMSDKTAVERLCEIKQRPKDKPFSLHISSKEEIEEYAVDIPASAYKLADKFWPGPLTLVLKAANNATIGMRMPDNEIALRVIEEAGVPVICPSANLSGKGAPGDFQSAIRDLQDKVDFAIDAGETRLKTESTIVDLSVFPAKIIRVGAIGREEIEGVIRNKTVLFICTGNSCRSVMAQALLQKKMKDKGRDNIEVISAGIMMLGGLSASVETSNLLSSEGIDVSSHRSQRVTAEMVKKSDIILVMEVMHEKRVLEIVPEAKNRLFLLKEFAKINDNSLDIPDPIGTSAEFYAETFGVIKEAVERVSNLI